MNAVDRTAMKKKDVNTQGYSYDPAHWPGRGSLLGAYMWAPSKKEYGDNKTIGGLVYDASGAVWTRSYYDHYSNLNYANYAWYVRDTSGSLDGYGDVNASLAVAPAFQLDLEKVLIKKLYIP